MTSARVERILDEIGQLSLEERTELARGLPGALRRGASAAGPLTVAAVRRAVETRERIRHRMVAEGLRPGSITADLDEVRASPLEGAPGMSVSREDPA